MLSGDLQLSSPDAQTPTRNVRYRALGVSRLVIWGQARRRVSIQSAGHEKLKLLFQKALEYEPEERLGFLRGACGGDEELMEEVLALLRHREKAGERLESPFLHPVGHEPPSELPTSLG